MHDMPDNSVEALAAEIFEITKITWANAQRSRRATDYDLTEAEFLALDALQQTEPQTVGDLQRRIGVLPAQMSRIIKGLETKYDASLVTCTINSEDKRKVDVRITPHGRQAADAFRHAKLENTIQTLAMLSEEDIGELVRIIRRMRRLMGAGPSSQA